MPWPAGGVENAVLAPKVCTTNSCRFLHPSPRGRWQLDLRAANRRQLIDAGVLPERIEVLDLCTYCRADLFFSHRRDRVTGRMGALIGMNTSG